MAEVDASIPLQVQDRPIDLAQIYSTAMQLRQMKQQMQTQNALKQLLAQPDAVDPTTGAPTSNTLAKITRIDPQAGIKLTGDVAAIDEHRAQTEHAQSETQMTRAKSRVEALSGFVDGADSELKAGNVPPDVILNETKQKIHDWIYSQPEPKAQQDADWAMVSDQDLTGLRRLSLTGQQRIDLAKQQQEEGDKAAGRNIQAEGLGERERHDKAQEAALGTSGGQILHDPTTDTDYVYYPRTHKATTLGGDAYDPGKAQHIASGTARSAIAMAMQKFIQENPDATAEDIAKEAGQYQATVTAGGAPAKAEAAGLSNLTKMRDSVSQAEGNARREAELTESLLDKGGLPGGPSAFGKWVQGARTGVFNDPDASSFQTAVESLKNEYVKVLSTQGGMSGGMSSDAARREADQYINPRLSKEQIRANIAVMRKSMQNRTDAIEDAIKTAQTRTRQSAGVPTDLPDASGHPDGTKARNDKGQVVAVIRDGQWSAP